MKSDKLLEIIGEAKEPYVLSALDSRNGKKKTRKRLSINRTFLIAAVIAMMLLLVGCAVVYVLSLQDIKVGEDTFSVPNHRDEEGNKVYETEVTRDVLSLQGYSGTPGFLAFREWNDFREAYDNPENEPEIPMEDRLDYLSYGCFFQSEIDKVDEICEKYDLHKLGIAWIEETPEIMFKALSINGLLLPQSSGEAHYYQGYYYWDGTFDIPFDLTLTGDNRLWNEPLNMRLRYVMKTAFDSVGISVSSVEDYEQWIYTTEQGVEVLLALSDQDALMIADLSDAFLTVQVDNITSGEKCLSREGLEAVAEMINFSVDPGAVDVAAAKDRYDAGVERARQQQEAANAVSPFELESYREYVDYLIAKTQNPAEMLYGVDPENLYYCILDFNEDGIMDFCWGVGGEKFSEIMTLEDGKIKLLYNQGIDSYLCENDILEQSYDIEGYPTGSYKYISIKNGAFEELCYLQFDRDAGIWQKAFYDDWGINWEEITEAEAMAIIQSYKRLDLHMKPITEFES